MLLQPVQADQASCENAETNSQEEEYSTETPRAKALTSFEQGDLFKSRIISRQRLVQEVQPAFTDLTLKFDWSKTILFQHCVAQKRFDKLKICDKREIEIMNFISNLRNSPE